MRRLHADFDLTFKALEEGLQVEHIAEFELESCYRTQRVSDILEDPRLAAYDQFPVRDGCVVVGVLERHRCSQADADTPVEEAMRRLDSSMLASNSQPVATLLEALQPNRYRLVVKDDGIEGIVTASDLLKMPVRLYAFMLVAHLEMLMAATIRKHFRRQPHEVWLARLPQCRQQQLRRQIERYKLRNQDPDPLELTYFGDKREILCSFAGPAVSPSNLLEIQRLRNSLAHTGDYLHDPDNQDDLQSLEQFLNRIAMTRRTIDHLRPPLGEDGF